MSKMAKLLDMPLAKCNGILGTDTRKASYNIFISIQVLEMDSKAKVFWNNAKDGLKNKSVIILLQPQWHSIMILKSMTPMKNFWHKQKTSLVDKCKMQDHTL